MIGIVDDKGRALLDVPISNGLNGVYALSQPGWIRRSMAIWFFPTS
jgi:hypothetical protein